MNCLLDCLKSLFTQHYFPKVLISQTAFWAVASFWLKNPTLVDVAWGTNHFLIGCSLYAAGGPQSNLLALILLGIWSFRLSGFLFYNRIWKRHVDPRYEKLRRNRNEVLYYFYQFNLQGILLTLTSIPLYFAFQKRSLNSLNYLGVGLCLIGVIGEAVADQQLQNYKNKRSDNSSVFRGGLFKYARHPNLFFEFTFWVGMAIYSINFNNYCSFVSFLGPTLLFLIVKYITVRITTKHMLSSKPDYNKIVEETNMFWPFTPKH